MALSGLKSALSDLKSILSGLQSALSVLESGISGLESGISGLRGRISGLKGRISGLIGQISGPRGHVSGLRELILGLEGPEGDYWTDIQTGVWTNKSPVFYRGMFTCVTRSMASRLSFIGVLLKVNLEAMLKVTRVNIPLKKVLDR